MRHGRVKTGMVQTQCVLHAKSDERVISWGSKIAIKLFRYEVKTSLDFVRPRFRNHRNVMSVPALYSRECT